MEAPSVATGDVDKEGHWIAQMLASEIYLAQRQLAARVALPDEQMALLLEALESRGGKLTRSALAQRLGVTEMRLTGMLSVIRRVLNVDQAQVIRVDETAGTVEFDQALLVEQSRPVGALRTGAGTRFESRLPCNPTGCPEQSSCGSRR